MASGSPSLACRANNSGFDFASDNVLCSYDDFSLPETSNCSHSDSLMGGASPNKDFLKTRMSRSAVFPPSNVYTQIEDSYNQELVETVEKTMKKYADNMMRFLEGISSRLSQLELYCYNLDKSIGEMRSDLAHDHVEADTKLKSVDKHLQEVHRSVQILRDKQELAETQKELAKIQLSQKESSSGGDHLQHEERNCTITSDSRHQDDASNLQLALALPHQVPPPQPSPLTRAPEQLQQIAPLSQAPPQMFNSQQPSYYLCSSPMPNPPTQPQPSQGPYMTTADSDSHYQAQQLSANPQQSLVNQSPQAQQLSANPSLVNQSPQAQQFPHYQQQWALPAQNVQPSQQVQTQTQIRAPSPTTSSNFYQTYIPGHPSNSLPQEFLSSSTPMQMPVSGNPQQGVSNTESIRYGYGSGGASTGRPLPSQLPPQHMNQSPPVRHTAISSGGSYAIYDGDAPRQHHPTTVHFSQGGGGDGYPPPSSVSLHNPVAQMSPPNSAGLMTRGPNPQQLVRNHPYSELMDKMVSMGYRGDHVASVIQRLEESGQPVDFNAVLDRLNGHYSSGMVSQRGW